MQRIWLNLWSSGQSLTAATNDRGIAYSMEGGVITYAGGRQRFRGQAGDRGQVSFTLLIVTLADVATLSSWRGKVVQVRDHRGQRWVGVFTEVAVRERKTPTQYDVSVTVNTVTADEGV